MKTKIILSVLGIVIICGNISAGGKIDWKNVLSVGTQMVSSVITQQNNNTRANADSYETDKKASYQRYKDQGYDIDPVQMAKEDRDRAYGADLQKADAWDNAQGGYNKAAAEVFNYKNNGKDTTDARNPSKQIIINNLHAAQSFIDLKGNRTAQATIALSAAYFTYNKIDAAKKLKDYDKGVKEDPDFYAAYDVDEKTGNLTFNPEKLRQYIESKYSSYSDEQQSQGITKTEWENQYWTSLQKNQNGVSSNNSSTLAEEAKHQAELQQQKAAEEAKRQAELQRQLAEQKAAEERKNAIQKIETTKIDGYNFDVTTLSQSQKSSLDPVADILNRYSDIKTLITGYTCNIGSKKVNQKIGLKRAEAGKEYLINKGIAPERITVDSKGKIQPIVPNTSNENRKLNRRIEFVIE